MLPVIFFMLICGFSKVHSAGLEIATDEELVNMIKTKKYVIVLFAKKDCELCENFENALIDLKEDIADSLSAEAVKAIDSQLLRLYTTVEEPQLIFFRHGMPLLFTGSLNEEEIMHMFIENKEPTVKELTDDTFEHLTQASSGATTGDWFVMFYSTDCVDCVRLTAKWETVGAKLKQRVNVAQINMYTTGASTARRIGVSKAPEFILFRHGKMYRYHIPKYDIDSFVSFAKEWYKNARAETVPVPQSPFDDLVQSIANFLREKPWVMKLGSMSIGIFIIISVASKFRRKTEMSQKKD